MGLKKLLRGVLTDEELKFLVRGYDVVGDIAVVIIPPELETCEKQIGEAILTSNRKIKVIVKRAGTYGGEFRTIPLKIIGGENRKETIHKEFGVHLFLHLEKVYFSSRSAQERMRIASLVIRGEKVLVMFSGIAPFPLVIAKHSKAKKIIGLEKNPVAHDYALKNLSLNKKLQNISLFKGDVCSLMPRLGKTFDRIVMPLPNKSENYLDTAIESLNKRGWLHFYEFQEKDRSALSIEKIMMASNRCGRDLLATNVFACGHTAPRIFRFCIDAQVG